MFSDVLLLLPDVVSPEQLNELILKENISELNRVFSEDPTEGHLELR